MVEEGSESRHKGAEAVDEEAKIEMQSREDSFTSYIAECKGRAVTGLIAVRGEGLVVVEVIAKVCSASAVGPICFEEVRVVTW